MPTWSRDMHESTPAGCIRCRHRRCRCCESSKFTLSPPVLPPLSISSSLKLSIPIFPLPQLLMSLSIYFSIPSSLSLFLHPLIPLPPSIYLYLSIFTSPFPSLPLPLTCPLVINIRISMRSIELQSLFLARAAPGRKWTASRRKQRRRIYGECGSPRRAWSLYDNDRLFCVR